MAGLLVGVLALRIGSVSVGGQRFPHGNTIAHSQASYYSSSSYAYDVSPTRGYHPDYDSGGAPYTSPVGTFAANGYGLHDMAGNVWEWCWDWYGSSYYGSAPGSDPLGPYTGTDRVLRGGSWDYGAYDSRVASRDYWPGYGNSSGIGFRAVLRSAQQIPQYGRIEVSGDGRPIPSGDTTPSLADGTDFGGDTTQSGSVSREFTLSNTGAAALEVASVAATGDFSVSGFTPLSIAPGGRASITIVFDASADGDRSGVVTIASNDPDTASFTFAVQWTASPADMALIPAGSFMMGGEGGGAVLEVFVSGFYMDKYEVTKAFWDEVYSWAVAHGYSFENAGSGKASDHPVHTVNWYDAVKWCNARSEKAGRTPAYYTSALKTAVYRTGQVDVQNDWVDWNAGYRLPTEAEWEKAARGPVSGQRFPHGNTIAHSQANYYSDGYYSYDVSPTRGYHPTYNDGVAPYTSPVGTFAANGYGLYDMAGNVWEWCWDWFGSSYYSYSTGSDPLGPAFGTFRMFRGGGWYNNFAGYIRVAVRNNYWPRDEANDIGFRSVLPAVQP